MDEELLEIQAEETVHLELDEVITGEIDVGYTEQNVEIESSIQVVDVEDVSEFDIEVDESVGWVGGDITRHYSLSGRDEHDQHPITAITGLREELDDIEKLKTVFSNKNNHADYYLWKDEHTIPEDSFGLFVSFYPTTNYIQVCNSTDEVFGVTVADAGFIGGQGETPRNNKYGLVVCSGIVSVRCETDVKVGDSVVSNNYGYAKKAEGGYGYKVIGIQSINDVLYAIIPLGISINQINDLMIEFDAFNKRVDEVETDIVAAINVAQAAHNKASESNSISEEALKNALDAILKADDALDKNEELENIVSSTNKVAVQAKAIAENAINEAESIRLETEKEINDALSDINDLVAELEPITEWTHIDGTGEERKGAEYLTTYIKNDVATKAEVFTVETLTEENKSRIEQSAESFESLVSSVDKYSVGEYSQAYGLSREQAKSILKEGMIYIPIKHINNDSHTEVFVGESEEQYFTPGNYYEWNGEDWIEYGNSVAFGMNVPNYTNHLQYWYIDSNKAPDGYEPCALYIWKNEKWTKVNTLGGNVNNRIVSSIRQTASGVALEVSNARGNYSGLDARLTEVDSQLQLATFWNKPGTDKSNLAAVNLETSDDGSKMALVVMSKDGEEVLSGANIILGSEGKKSSIALDADNIVFEGTTKFLTADDVGKKGTTTINGALIETNTVSASALIADEVMAGFINALDITAQRVVADAIKSDNYQDEGHRYAKKGCFLNLADGTFKSPGFAIDSSGNSFLNGFIYAKGGELKGTLYFGASGSDYVLNSEDYYINIPGFQVHKTEQETQLVGSSGKTVKTHSMIKNARLAGLYVSTDESFGVPPQVRIMDNGIWMFGETDRIRNDDSTRSSLCWENADGTPMMNLRGGYKSIFDQSGNELAKYRGVILESLDVYEDRDLDFYAFGMSMRDMYNKINELAYRLDNIAPHEHSYTKTSTTATCTAGGIATFTCSCGNSYTQSESAIGHNYSDGVCIHCGQEEPPSPTCSHTHTSTGGNRIDACHAEMWEQCDDCGEILRTWTDNTHSGSVSTGGNVIDSCHQEMWTQCDSCGEILSTWIETSHGSVNDNGYCNDCGEYVG